MTHILDDTNRRKFNLHQPKVKEVLPEHFTQDYPTLITFLEKYYQFLDSSSDQSFNTQIRNLFNVRDIQQTSEDNLDQIVKEIGNGLQVSSFFQEPRLMAKLLADFYTSKGTLVSAEAFFRAFFNEEVTIEYPKEQMFIVNESQIGYESQKFIQDDELYQVFSILVKIGLSVEDYQTLYNRFVHPAGWHFRGQVSTEGTVELDLEALSADPLDSAGGLILAETGIVDIIAPFSETTALLESDGTQIRVRVDEPIENYGDLTVTEIGRFYDDIASLVTPNSFTMDDSADSIGPDLSLNLETIDNTMFKRYTSDSSI